MATFATRLKELRNAKGLSQPQLAETIGVSKQSISLWERGPRKPEFSTLDALADFFQVSLGYLLGTSDDNTPPQLVGDPELAGISIEEDDQELTNLAVQLAQLSPGSRKIVTGAITAAYRLDRENGILVPAEKHHVEISTVGHTKK